MNAKRKILGMIGRMSKHEYAVMILRMGLNSDYRASSARVHMQSLSMGQTLEALAVLINRAYNEM